MPYQRTIRYIVRVIILVATCSFQTFPSVGQSISEEKLLRSTRNKLQDDFDDTDNYNLGKKILAAEQVVERDQSPKSKKQLARLVERRELIVDTIAEASQSSAPIYQRILQLKPHAEYLTADPELMRIAQESRLALDLANAIRSASSSGDPGSLEESLKGIRESELESVFGTQLQSALRQGILKRIETLTVTTQDSDDHQLATDIILKRLLGLPNEKLKLALNFIGENPDAASLFENSLKRIWGNSFDLSFEDPAQTHEDSIALSGTIKLSPLFEEIEKQDQSVSSSIPGHVKVVENPKFERALALYENADQAYQEAIDRYYDQDHRVFLEELEDINTQSQRTVIEEAQRQNPELGEQEILNTGESVQQIQHKNRAQIHLRNLSTPEPPEPPHDKLLKDVISTPPTIEETTEDEPYQYVQRSISMNLKSEAYLKLDTAFADATIERSPSLEHNNNWFENIGVHPRDNAAARGNYNESERESARKLFLLSFSADCSKQMKAALSELSRSLWQKGTNTSDPQLAAFGLAIQLSQQHSNTTQLSLERLIELSKTLSPLEVATPEVLDTLVVEFATPLATWDGVTDSGNQI